jgi:uncharacterized membrane protein
MAYTSADYASVPATRFIYEVLLSFPVCCFTLVLLTDIAYWQTSYLMWQDFSSWLLFAGIVAGALAWIAGVLDALIGSTPGARGPAPRNAGLGLVVLGLAVVNSLLHAGDGWTAVVPWGLLLSAVTVLVMALGGWLGRRRVLRYAGGRVDG